MFQMPKAKTKLRSAQPRQTRGRTRQASQAIEGQQAPSVAPQTVVEANEQSEQNLAEQISQMLAGQMQKMKAGIQTSVMSMVTEKLQETLNTNITPVPERPLNNDPAPMAAGPSSITSRAAENVLQGRNNVQSVQLSTTFHTLGDEVTDRIKSQIWANEYVDLARLLNTDSQRNWNSGCVRMILAIRQTLFCKTRKL